MRWIMALLLSVSTMVPAAAVEVMSAAQARAAAEAGEIVIVDIRTPAEWTASGIPDVAMPINMQADDFVDRLVALMTEDPNRPIAMICATGGRSGYVTKALEARGVPGLINVSEGMFGSQAGPGWLARGLPVRQPGG